MSEVDELIEALGLGPMRSGIDSMMTRASDFPSPVAAMLAGAAVREESRFHMDALAAERWGREWVPPTGFISEVVIGSGPHALIYAAVRASKGVKVTLLEQSERAGGSFACSGGPSFWLNSRNRPGPLGLPGEGRGLNVLPGCVLQPSMVGGGEYQSNDMLAWVIRANLMMMPNVEVHTGVKVETIRQRSGSGYNLLLSGAVARETSIKARRVVIATGLGAPNAFVDNPTKVPDRMVTFGEFMGKMDLLFPLRGMSKVAVIGAGDSGKTAVEALLGQGPSTGLSVSALDFPEQIDWYGCTYRAQQTWCEENRGRYSRIGKALGGRVKPTGKAVFYPSPGFQSVQIGPLTYDLVVNCTGYTGQTPLANEREKIDYSLGNRLVARRVRISANRDEVYLVGPAARIPLTDSERRAVPALANIPDNATSIFRYAPLTAAFADSLPEVGSALAQPLAA